MGTKRKKRKIKLRAMRKKVLSWTSLALAFLATSYTGSAAAAGITTQAEATDLLNTPLDTGDLTYTEGITTDHGGSVINNVEAAEPIGIGGAASSTLHLRVTLPEGHSYSNAHNLTSFKTEGPILVGDLDTLRLTLEGAQGNTNSLHTTSNMVASSGGTITIDGSVKKIRSF